MLPNLLNKRCACEPNLINLLRQSEYITYDFVGNPTGRKLVHTEGSKTRTELYSYTYDHAGRLLKTMYKPDSKPEVLLAENTYDELGRLQTTRRGGSAKLTTSYAYNIRSWTESISSPLFSQTLYYTKSYGGSRAQYNGNISAITWKASDEPSLLRGYAFSYDALSRLTGAEYLVNGTANKNYGMPKVSYDKHGNMSAMQLYGKTGSGTYGRPHDDVCRQSVDTGRRGRFFSRHGRLGRL